MKHLTTLGLAKIVLASQLLAAPVFADDDTSAANALFNKYCVPHFADSSLLEGADYDYMIDTLSQKPQRLYFERASNLEAINSVKVNGKELLGREIRGNFEVPLTAILSDKPKTLTIETASRGNRNKTTIKLTFDENGKIIGEKNPDVNKAVSCYREGSEERYQTFAAIYGLKR